jgi:hypothetical protein
MIASTHERVRTPWLPKISNPSASSANVIQIDQQRLLDALGGIPLRVPALDFKFGQSGAKPAANRVMAKSLV